MVTPEPDTSLQPQLPETGLSGQGPSMRRSVGLFVALMVLGVSASAFAPAQARSVGYAAPPVRVHRTSYAPPHQMRPLQRWQPLRKKTAGRMLVLPMTARH